MRKILIFTVLLFLFKTTLMAQSYKNIDFYTNENTKIARFYVHGLNESKEQAIVFEKILYSYPDIYFVNVSSNGSAVAFLAKTSLLEKFHDEILEKNNYEIRAVSYENYIDEIFLDYYLEASYKINIKENVKPFDMVKLGDSRKNELNYAIAKEIYDTQMGTSK